MPPQSARAAFEEVAAGGVCREIEADLPVPTALPRRRDPAQESASSAHRHKRPEGPSPLKEDCERFDYVPTMAEENP